MSWYFANEKRQRALLAEAESWVGTPFCAHARLKQAGVDCVNLAAGIYQACGLSKEFAFPQYQMDRGSHCSESLVIPWLEKSARFLPVQARVGELMPGDLVVFKVGQTTHHVGVALGPDFFIHVWQRHVAMKSNLTDSTWAKRLAAIYRPVDKSDRTQRTYEVCETCDRPRGSFSFCSACAAIPHPKLEISTVSFTEGSHV